jgi:WD40 repeat protein
MGDAERLTRFLAVVGPSGSGKSSLVKAGLIPALWQGKLAGSEKWFVAEMLPGSHPLEELEIALIRVAANQAANLHEQLSRDERGLLRIAQLILPEDGSELVLVVDQFEEVFTLVEDEAARQHFLNLLLTAVTDSRSRVRVVVTLRADYYDRPLHYPEFGEVLRSRMETVLPLGAKALERAIAGPAERVGVTFEPGLVAQIVAEMNYQAGALPLLQYALTELFERREGRRLTHQAYQEIGGAGGALANRADELYLSFDETGRELARQMFLRLVTLGEGAEDTRRRVARSELLAIGTNLASQPPLHVERGSRATRDGGEVSDDLMDEIIDTYATYRLLSLDNDPATHTPTVEVAHEAILREWERLRGWLNESRDEIKLQRQLAAMAAEWRTNKEDHSYLAHGSRLGQVEAWAKDTQLALTPHERTFLDASIAERERQHVVERERQAREKRLEQHSRNFLRGLVAVFVVATLIGFGLAGIAINQSQIAQRNAAESQNVALVAGSQAAFATGNTDQAIALALQAVTLNPTSAPAQVALGQAAYTPGTMRRFMAHTDAIDNIALSPDGRTFVSGSWDHTLILWDIQTGAIIRRFQGHTDIVTSVAFSPDGRTFISGSPDKTLILWDVQTGAILRRFVGGGEVWGMSLSPDGKTAVSGGADNFAILWDVQTGAILRRLGADGNGHTGAIESPVFSPDGRTVLTGAWDNTLILWDVQTGTLIRRFGGDGKGHTQPITAVVFSPDGRTALSGGRDNTIILWDVAAGTEIRRMKDVQGWVQGLAFSPDGHTALSPDGNNLVSLWNVDTGERIRSFQGHSQMVFCVVIMRDGRTAISGSADGEIRLWDLEQGQVIRRFGRHPLGITGIDRSPDGSIALSGSQDGTAIFWDIQTGKELGRYTSTYPLSSVSIAPDGKTALITSANTAGNEGELLLLDIHTGSIMRRFGPLPTAPYIASFSPDGLTAVSTGAGGYVILWDVATGTEIRRFTGHENYQLNNPNMGGYGGFFTDGSIGVYFPAAGTAITLNASTGQEVRQFTMEPYPFCWLFTDGKTILSFAGLSPTLIDTTTNTTLRYYPELASVPFAGMNFTPDGRLGIAGAFDGTTRIWDMQTGHVIRRMPNLSVPVGALTVLPDAHEVVVGLNDGQVELWRIDSTLDELLAWTKANRYIPDLTCDQRALYRLEPLCDANGTTSTNTPVSTG